MIPGKNTTREHDLVCYYCLGYTRNQIETDYIAHGRCPVQLLSANRQKNAGYRLANKF